MIPKSRGVDAAEVGDHLLGQPVTEVLLLGIAGEVLERQHGQHDPHGRRGRPRDGQNPDCVAAEGDQRRHSKGKRCPAPDGRWRPSRWPRLVDFRRRLVEYSDGPSARSRRRRGSLHSRRPVLLGVRRAQNLAP